MTRPQDEKVRKTFDKLSAARTDKEAAEMFKRDVLSEYVADTFLAEGVSNSYAQFSAGASRMVPSNVPGAYSVVIK